MKLHFCEKWFKVIFRMKNYQVLLMIIIHCANISMWKSHNDAHRIWSKFHFIQQKAFSSSINRWSLNLRYTIKTFYRASFNGTFPSSDWWAIVSSYLPPIELIFFCLNECIWNQLYCECLSTQKWEYFFFRLHQFIVMKYNERFLL